MSWLAVGWLEWTDHGCLLLTQVDGARKVHVVGSILDPRAIEDEATPSLRRRAEAAAGRAAQARAQAAAAAGGGGDNTGSGKTQPPLAGGDDGMQHAAATLIFTSRCLSCLILFVVCCSGLRGASDLGV